MATNWKLKLAVQERYGSQINAVQELGIREQRLSYIVRGHIAPSTNEMAALRNAFGAERIEELIGAQSAQDGNTAPGTECPMCHRRG